MLQPPTSDMKNWSLSPISAINVEVVAVETYSMHTVFRLLRMFAFVIPEYKLSMYTNEGIFVPIIFAKTKVMLSLIKMLIAYKMKYNCNFLC